jgi:hypothetical protein
MANIRRGGPALLTLLAFLAASGCNRGPALAPVEGTVRMNGRPLANVQVEFWPEASGARSTGLTDKDGRYQLTYDGKQAGAAVGPHRVLLYDLQVYGENPLPRGGRRNKDADVTPVRASRFPASYSDSVKTPLKREVGASPNVIDLEVTP